MAVIPTPLRSAAPRPTHRHMQSSVFVSSSQPLRGPPSLVVTLRVAAREPITTPQCGFADHPCSPWPVSLHSHVPEKVELGRILAALEWRNMEVRLRLDSGVGQHELVYICWLCSLAVLIDI